MKVERSCPVCTITYHADSARLKFGRQTTCSRACSYRLRGTNLENNLTLKCSVCGDEFNRAVSAIKGKHGGNFCSPACHYAGRGTGATARTITEPYKITEKGRDGWAKAAKKTRETRILRDNYRHTDATRALLSEKTSNAIAQGRVPVVSRLEDKVAAELTAMGYEFIRQYPVRSQAGTFACVFDFLIGDIALEVNGTFWHSDPRFFPGGPEHKIQERNAVAWSRKLAHAAHLNIRVVEVWEHDIKQGIREAISHALGAAA